MVLFYQKNFADTLHLRLTSSIFYQSYLEELTPWLLVLLLHLQDEALKRREFLRESGQALISFSDYFILCHFYLGQQMTFFFIQQLMSFSELNQYLLSF